MTTNYRHICVFSFDNFSDSYNVGGNKSLRSVFLKVLYAVSAGHQKRALHALIVLDADVNVNVCSHLRHACDHKNTQTPSVCNLVIAVFVFELCLFTHFSPTIRSKANISRSCSRPRCSLDWAMKTMCVHWVCGTIGGFAQ